LRNSHSAIRLSQNSATLVVVKKKEQAKIFAGAILGELDGRLLPN
jgi:hypothetical protein